MTGQGECRDVMGYECAAGSNAAGRCVVFIVQARRCAWCAHKPRHAPLGALWTRARECCSCATDCSGRRARAQAVGGGGLCDRQRESQRTVRTVRSPDVLLLALACHALQVHVCRHGPADPRRTKYRSCESAAVLELGRLLRHQRHGIPTPCCAQRMLGE